MCLLSYGRCGPAGGHRGYFQVTGPHLISKSVSAVFLVREPGITGRFALSNDEDGSVITGDTRVIRPRGMMRGRVSDLYLVPVIFHTMDFVECFITSESRNNRLRDGNYLKPHQEPIFPSLGTWIFRVTSVAPKVTRKSPVITFRCF